MRDQLKWYDDKVANSPWIDALAELRQGHCFQHVQAITVAIDQYGEKALGKVPLPGLPWSPAFMEVYEAALANSGAVVVGASRTMAGTLNAAVVAYYQSAAFKCELGEGSKAGQRSLVERFRTEHGDKRLRKLERRHLQAYISSLRSAAVQRNMLRALRHFLKFCKASGLIDHDPSEGVTRQKMKNTGGFYTWTEDDAAKYEAHHIGRHDGARGVRTVFEFGRAQIRRGTHRAALYT